MSDLTLEQVRKVGRFATHGCGLLSWGPQTPDNVFAYHWVDGEGRRVTTFLTAENGPLTGWRHFSGCDCEFCRA
jgi:hypothetical protein